MKSHTMTAALVAALSIVGAAQAATFNWVGGTGEWQIGPNWDDGSGAVDSLTAFGTTNGWEFDSPGAPIDPEIVIGAGGDVFYSALDFGDFRLNQGAPENGGSLIVTDGGKFGIGPFGFWTQIDADEFTVTGAGSEFTRFNEQKPLSPDGGILVLGSWRSYPNQVIAVNVLDGASFYNEGQITFGIYEDSDPDLNVTLTIGEDATVSNNTEFGVETDGFIPEEAYINFVYNWDPVAGAPDDSTYALNFAGSGGSLTVGAEGLAIQTQNSATPTDWTSTVVTYEQLWDLGILQANGMSGPDGANFADFFSVTGALGMDAYTVIALPDNISGDFNGDGAYDCLDINELTSEIATGTNNASFDLTGDGLVNLDDQTAWLAEAATANGIPGPYLPGDADLSGAVDVSDFNIFNTNKFTNNTDWCAGNFDGNNGVDVSDFNIWNTNKFTSSDVNSVPEPAGFLSMLMAMAGLGLWRRRCR